MANWIVALISIGTFVVITLLIILFARKSAESLPKGKDYFKLSKRERSRLNRIYIKGKR